MRTGPKGEVQPTLQAEIGVVIIQDRSQPIINHLVDRNPVKLRAKPRLNCCCPAERERVADLKAGSARTSEFIRSLTDEQLELTQEFAWAGTQNVGWVASGAVRHPKGHLKSIKEALGR